MFSKTMLKIWRGVAAVMLSLLIACIVGYTIANTWRSTLDSALGTKSFITESTDAKYVSTYSNAEDLMKANKAFAVKQGAEGTAIMKNDNSVFPLTKNTTVALFGGASYSPYFMAAGNSDQVNLVGALESAGFTVDATLKTIYDNILAEQVQTGTHPWTGQPVYASKYGPNTSAGDYITEGYQIKEANPSLYTTVGLAAANWQDSVTADVAIITFLRPGGEGTTYKPGVARDTNGDPLNQNPLALSPDELAVVETAKQTCDKVVVLLNTSCTIELGPLVKASGQYEVDGIAYIGIPNDYQFTGIVQALAGDVNPTGALADTYATDSAGSPAMMNFGGDVYSDYTIVDANTANSNYDDPRWPGMEIGNGAGGSFGGATTYSGGLYIVQAEGIYTGYMYYETRYYDSVMAQGSAASSAGSTQGGNWEYSKEVSYTFGHGLSYLPYEQKLISVDVQDRVDGEVTAKVSIKNNGNKKGKFLAQLYVQTPYSDYDKANLVEKSAIQFLNSKKVEVAAGATEEVEIKIPTKYLASYDWKTAKTYIMDYGTYYFAVGNGAHDAVNNIITKQGKTGDTAGNTACVATWDKTGGTEKQADASTYSKSEAGVDITNVADNADLNYYLPNTVTYLTRNDWSGTYPKNYNTINSGKGVSLAASNKKDEWVAELRNQQYTVKTDEPVNNVYGIKGATFADIQDEHAENIEHEFWNQLVNAITLDEALGAVAHGGSQSDTLKNIENPIVTQNDGPNGFNNKALSTNNLDDKNSDPYYVDATTEAGKFKGAINSQTLTGSCFDPDLVLEWGKILGNNGLWIRNYQIWAGGLNYHRSPYNGRNTEYLSEDPMLTNVLGKALIEGSLEFGIIVGPKHFGFNDQEYDRAGICVYMHEQKMRETDIRGFQGAIEDAKALGFMTAFNRIGAINVSHHVGLLVGIVRNEWDFNGLISTDMMNNKWYFNPESCTMATVTQMADFAGDNSSLSLGTGGVDATWTYLSVAAVKNDNTLITMARECMKYQLFAFANSAVRNISTTKVMPAWEAGIIAGIVATAVLAAGATALWLVSIIKSKKEAE